MYLNKQQDVKDTRNSYTRHHLPTQDHHYPALTMRLTTPISSLLACISIASAQGCPNSSTACGYAAQLCCTGDKICMTNENNQALCEVPDTVNSTLTLVVSTNSGTMTAVTVTSTPMLTQGTGVGSSESVSETGVGGASGTALGSSTGLVSLFSSATQRVDASAESSAGGVESTASTTSAEPTASTDASNASDAPASTTAGAAAKVGRSWYGMIGVGVGVGMVTVLMG